MKIAAEFDPKANERRTLIIVLALNILLVVGFGIAGILADSNALIANGLDNASDSLVYIISLVALRHGPEWKRGAARMSGILLLLFGAGVLGDAARRYFTGSDPLGPAMLAMAAGAGVINALCVWLLKRLRGKDVNLRAATTFSVNDFISNGGILIAGALVMWTGKNWPDLLVGAAVAAIAAKGATDIIRDASAEARAAKAERAGEP